MKSLFKIISFVFVFFAIIWLLDFVLSSIFHKDTDLLLHHGIGQITFYVLFILNVYLFQTYVNQENFMSLGLKPYPGVWTTFLKGWLAGVLAFVFYTLLMKISGVIDLQAKYSIGRIVTAFLVAFSAFGIALTEEILFRGFFLQTLLKDLPKWVAIVITGIMFVLFHDLAKVSNFWTVPKHMMLAGGLFCLNILLCFAYLKSGSLYLPVAIHSGLVFSKIFFRKMKMIHILSNSYLFGIDGDARRGLLAWLLFLSGIFILKYLITNPKSQNNISSSLRGRRS